MESDNLQSAFPSRVNEMLADDGGVKAAPLGGTLRTRPSPRRAPGPSPRMASLLPPRSSPDPDPAPLPTSSRPHIECDFSDLSRNSTEIAFLPAISRCLVGVIITTPLYQALTLDQSLSDARKALDGAPGSTRMGTRDFHAALVLSLSFILSPAHPVPGLKCALKST